jgi:hypothetical protein
LAWQILEGVGIQQGLVELSPLPVVHLHERLVADQLLDAAAELAAGDCDSLRRAPC